ncbi:MAG: Imm1 family immunity protein [Actinomycetota bacterium]|nr:Imm1 family immunity protein [Actinomycetota bacterium]
MISDVLRMPSMHVNQVAPNVDLVAEIRELNTGGVMGPWAWSILAGPEDPFAPGVVTLTVGVHGNIGALVWLDQEKAYVPTSGSNTKWCEYRLGGMHESPIPPFAEVPVETVYIALAEFLNNHCLPTCVEWRQAAPIETLFQDRAGPT